MADSIAELQVRITGDNSDAKRALSEAKDAAHDTHGSFIELNQAAELVEKGFDILKETIGESVRMFIESEASSTRLSAILKATGGVAGQTADDLENLSKTMADTTIFDDDKMKNAEALMLTFKSVAGDTFKDAIRGAADLSSAFGMDLNSATVMLGKALEDPVAGLTALHRVGVSFSEDEKKMIQAMKDAGDTAGAQGKILQVLEGQVGGVSKAMRDSSSGSVIKFQQALEDLQKAAGKTIVEGLAPIADGLTKMIRGMLDTDQSAQGMLNRFRQMRDAANEVVGPVTENNKQNTLTSDQYKQLIQVYPQLASQVTAYSTTLAEVVKKIKEVNDAESVGIRKKLQEAVVSATSDIDALGSATSRMIVQWNDSHKGKAIPSDLSPQNLGEVRKAIADLWQAAKDGTIQLGPAELGQIHKFAPAIQQLISLDEKRSESQRQLAEYEKTGNLEAAKSITVASDAAKAKGVADEDMMRRRFVIAGQEARAADWQKISAQQTIDDFNKEIRAVGDFNRAVDTYGNKVEDATDQTDAWRDRLLRVTGYLSNQIPNAMTNMIAGPFTVLGKALHDQTDVWDALRRGALHALGGIVDGIGRELAAMAAADFTKGLAMAVNPSTAAAAPGYFAASGIEASGAAAAFTAAGILGAFKDGTDYVGRSGSYLVGEAGPEIVRLPQGSSVVNNSQISEVGGNQNYSVTIVNPSQPTPGEMARQMSQTLRVMAAKAAFAR